jgi:hypothetical protein
MNCDFAPTGEIHKKSGRKILRCRRPGCTVFGLMPPSGDPKNLINASGCKVGGPSEAPKLRLLASETKELFGDDDPMLWGNRIKALTDAIGIPPCGGCEKRRQWLNKATLWLRGG